MTESGQSTATTVSQQAQQRREQQRRQWFAISAALFGWLGLALQLMLSVQPDLAGVSTIGGTAGAGGDPAHALLLFVSDYTHWATLFATLLLSYAALPTMLCPRPLAPTLMTAAAIYVTMVVTGYHFLLHDYRHVTGVPQLAGNLLHYVVPLLFLMYWWLFVGPSRAGWRQIGRWASLPLVYAAFVVLSGTYPAIYAYRYGADEMFGPARSLAHAVAFMAAYGLIAWAVVFLDRRKR